MKTFGFCLFLLLLQTGCAIAQDSTIAERKLLSRLILGFDARSSFISGEPARIQGAKVGIELHDRYRFGLGVYALSTPMHRTIYAPELGRDVRARFRFSYVAAYGEYVFYASKNRKWELSTPVQLGWSEVHFRYEDENGRPLLTPRRNAWLIEPCLTAQYKFTYWLGAGAGIGYRQMLVPPRHPAHNLDAPIYFVKLKIFIVPLVQKVIPYGRKVWNAATHAEEEL